MGNNFAEVLESYLIPAQEGIESVIAEEGFGSIIGATIAAPFVLLGGSILISEIKGKMHEKKLMKKIKNNNGKYDYYNEQYGDYGSDVFRIIQKNSNAILGVIEPINKDAYLNACLKLVNISKEIKTISNQIKNIKEENFSEYVKYYNKINILQKKANEIIKEIKNIDLEKLNTNPVKLNDTIFSKLNKIPSSIVDTLDFDLAEDLFNKADNTNNPKIKLVANSYDMLIDSIWIGSDRIGIDCDKKYISKCKFAISKDSNLFKKK